MRDQIKEVCDAAVAHKEYPNALNLVVAKISNIVCNWDHEFYDLRRFSSANLVEVANRYSDDKRMDLALGLVLNAGKERHDATCKVVINQHDNQTGSELVFKHIKERMDQISGNNIVPYLLEAYSSVVSATAVRTLESNADKLNVYIKTMEGICAGTNGFVITGAARNIQDIVSSVAIKYAGIEDNFDHLICSVWGNFQPPIDVTLAGRSPELHKKPDQVGEIFLDDEVYRILLANSSETDIFRPLAHYIACGASDKDLKTAKKLAKELSQDSIVEVVKTTRKANEQEGFGKIGEERKSEVVMYEIGQTVYTAEIGNKTSSYIPKILEVIVNLKDNHDDLVKVLHATRAIMNNSRCPSLTTDFLESIGKYTPQVQGHIGEALAMHVYHNEEDKEKNIRLVQAYCEEQVQKAANTIDPEVAKLYINTIEMVAEKSNLNHVRGIALIAQRLSGKALAITLSALDNIANYHSYPDDPNRLLGDVINYALRFEGNDKTLTAKMTYINGIVYTTHSFSYREEDVGKNIRLMLK